MLAPDVRFDAQGDAVALRHISQCAERLDRLLQTLLVIRGAARAAVDDRNADFNSRLEGRFHGCLILRRLLHRQQFEVVLCRQPTDLRRQFLPAIEDEMFAHAVNGGDLNPVIP